MKSALLFILNDPLFYGFVFAGLAIGFCWDGLHK